MINSKQALLKALREGKIRAFKTIRNDYSGKWVGIERMPGDKIQTNAFTILSPIEDGEMVLAWNWFSKIDVKNNLIVYKNGLIEIEIIEQ